MFEQKEQVYELFECEECGLETDLNKHMIGNHTLCDICHEEVMKVGVIGARLPEHLTDKMKKHVKEIKKFRSYSLQELVREAVENFLKETEDDRRD